MQDYKYNYSNYHSTMPGNLTKDEALQRMMRVNHAGELAAVQIYKWQARFLPDLRDELKLMQTQEGMHLAYFENLMQERGLKKSKLTPIWKMAGSALGIGTAILGKTAARICTEAVEDAIVQHYDQQLEITKDDQEEEKLTSEISKIRDEELEHSHKSEEFSPKKQNFREKILEKMISKGCKIAIKIAQRI